MTVDDIISGVRSLIPYDNNQAVRETLYPIDGFVRKALGDALTELTSEGLFLEKSIFIPLITNENIYNLVIDNLTKNKFSPTAPKSIALFPPPTSPGIGVKLKPLPITVLTGLFSEEDDEDILKTSMRNLGTQYSLILSQVPGVGSAVGGLFGKVTSVSGNTVELNQSTNTGQYVINLEFADKYKYESASIINAAHPVYTLSKDVSAWSPEDRVFICNVNPTLIHIMYTGITTPEYFVSNTDVVPMRDILRPEIEGLVMRNLFKYLAVRMPEMMKIYAGLVKAKLIMDADEIIRSARGKIETNLSSPGYLPFTELYGR